MSAARDGGAAFPSPGMSRATAMQQGRDAYSFHDACILAALPAVLTQCACRGDWEDATVARRCIELADVIIGARFSRG